jgi:CheY-like chemotaxis protein
VADTHRTGVLRLGGGDGVDAWFERGDLRLASPREAAAGRRVLATAGMAEEPGRAAGWSGAARAAGVPLAVMVADECGPAGSAALRTIGRQALVRQTAEGPVEWSWSDLPGLPEAVARAALPISIDQLALDRLRLVDDWSQVELDVSSLGQVCERAPAMRQRLPLFELTPEEAKVLLLVDGRRPVKDVLERSGLSTFDVFHILYRLIQVRLVQPRGDAPVRRCGPVLLCAGDGVAGPLADWLGRRGETLAACVPGDLLDRILAAAPRLALVDLDGVADPEALARAVRARLEISDTPLIALAPRADRGLLRALADAGYDRVLAKPVHLNAIGRVLDGLEPGASP